MRKSETSLVEVGVEVEGVHYFFRGVWMGGVEEWRLKLSQLST